MPENAPGGSCGGVKDRKSQQKAANLPPLFRNLPRESIVTFTEGIPISSYLAALKEHTTLDLSPEKVHETGRQEVERIEKKIIELLKQQEI